MTALQLLGLISAALVLQLAIGIGIGWRRMRRIPAVAPERIDHDAPEPTGAWPGWRDFRVSGRAFEDAARTQCSFHLQPVDGKPLPPFQPGQYLTFSLSLEPDPAIDPGRQRPVIRCYSLSERPDPAGYRITVKRAQPPPDRPDLPPGAASTHLHDRIHERDVLRVKAPAGRFGIDSDASVPAVFIAGGIGITPMMSMLRWCVDAQPGRALFLFYGVRNGDDHAFKSVLEALAQAHPGFRLHVVYSAPGPRDLLGRDFQHAGRIDVDLLRASLPHGRHRFHVCGPPPMMRSLVPALRDWGVLETDLHYEAFGPATVPAATASAPAASAAPQTALEVRFSRSGRTLVWTGQDANLLEFAERHGVQVESGCRSGSCGSCETRVESGRVAYAERPDHDLAEGRCLLCVGRPESALVLQA